MKRRRKSLVVIGLNALFSIILAVLKTLTIDLVRNVILYFKLSTSKEEREKIKKHLEVEKKQELNEERLKRLERLTYAVYNDPSYAKRKEGEYDLKHLKQGIDK